MNNTEEITNLFSEHYNYLCSQVATIEKLPYFENIKKYPVGSFLLSIYNIVSIIKDHNLHIALATTKVESEFHIKNLAKILYENTCAENESSSEHIEKFLIQFMEKGYSETYYKKYAVISLVDKLSNDLCQIILDKNWVQVIASLATFELILSKISNKFNLCAQTNFTLLNTTRSEKNCLLLLNSISEKDKYEIKLGIIDTLNIFLSFFNELNNQFYCD